VGRDLSLCGSRTTTPGGFREKKQVFEKFLEMAIFWSYSRLMKIGIAAAKDQLPALVRRAQDGEKILLTRNGHIVAMLRGYRMRGTDHEWIAKIINSMSADINVKHKTAGGKRAEPR
jgi:antitoxin (DNA-binding transcriptional repressor) of toxin-antitoxin stability system